MIALVRIDGKKFLKGLGLLGVEPLTPEMIAQKLLDLSESERLELEEKCIIKEKVCIAYNQFGVVDGYYTSDELKSELKSLKTMLKHCKNQAERITLQKRVTSVQTAINSGASILSEFERCD